MTEINDKLMSISSNSQFSTSDIEPPISSTAKKKPSKLTTRKRAYTVNVAHVPKRTFDQVQRRLKKNKSVIDVRKQTSEQTNCNRFIYGQTDGDRLDTISPESTTRLMWEMRKCLQHKDYGNLARLISAFSEMPMGKQRWYPTLIKYCLIALMYDPLVHGTELLNMFLDGVMGCRTEADRRGVLKDISQLPSNIHVTKYDDLWIKYPMPNQMNKSSLDQLCEILSKRFDINAEDDRFDDGCNTNSDSDSEWESYDENNTDDENDETTETERPCDFNSILNDLEEKLRK